MLHTIRQQPESRGNNRYLNIAQWNACSLNKAKTMELSMLTEENHIDVICISELSSRRRIAGFPFNECDDRYTQSGIFWREHVQVEIMHPPSIQVFANNAIMTQIVK